MKKDKVCLWFHFFPAAQRPAFFSGLVQGQLNNLALTAAQSLAVFVEMVFFGAGAIANVNRGIGCWRGGCASAIAEKQK